ncbi:MAG: mRNA cleavage and polyadenylation factor subunit [Pycnora praestabilis]|nr:MAG: mRNA cleavage and polyadenylation factor subunit [Pycnora praestabilis]
MQCYAELIPPTAVTHALSLPFISANSNNLVVAKTSLLQVFSFRKVNNELHDERNSHGDPEDIARTTNHQDSGNNTLKSDLAFHRSERTQITKLVLITEVNLSGTVTSLAGIKNVVSRSGGEALLIAFSDAKLSLIEWDPERHGISTISIHYYEQEDLMGSPWAPDLGQCVSYLTADPSSRCAALKFGVRSLAILPFRQAGDDLVMEDYDPEIDGEPPEPTPASKQVNGDSSTPPTPYGSSFVLPLSALDPGLIHPIHLSFLFEYREPTFGILSSTVAASSSLLYERRDTVSYAVFTLDLEQRASTTLLSISGLPFDLQAVIPLPLPVGGALLVGDNELIHVDQAGKTNGVGVNSFAKRCSSYAMADQSELEIQLENCKIEQLGLDSGEMLIVLNTGHLAIVSFKLDGRSVSGVAVRRIAPDHGGLSVKAGASCTALVGNGKLFIGSEDADSIVLGWTRKTAQLSRKRSSAGIFTGDTDMPSDEEEIEDYDDDLYSSAVQDSHQEQDLPLASKVSQDGDYSFRVHDYLPNTAPMRDLVLGHPASNSQNGNERSTGEMRSDLELVTPTGRCHAGGVSILKRKIEPRIVAQFRFPEVRGIWSVCAKRPNAGGPIQQSTGKNKQISENHVSVDTVFDRFMIVSKASKNGSEDSAVYALTPMGFEQMKGTEFDPAAGATVDVGTLAGATRVIQILHSEIRSYDGDLSIAQIFPMTDEITGAEPKVVSTSFADPYLLIVRDDSSVIVLEADDHGDLDEVERGDALLATKWISGSLYTDQSHAFQAEVQDNKGNKGKDARTLLFLLSAEGGLHIFNAPDLRKPVYVAPSLSFLPSMITAEYTVRRSTARETLTELLVADLGDTVANTPHLILRAANDDLTIYEPFFYLSDDSPKSLSSSLRFLKISNPHLAKAPAQSAHDTAGAEQELRDNPLRAVGNIGGYSTVFMPGGSPSFVVKSASSAPRVLSLTGMATRGMSGFHTPGCDRGWVYVDVKGTARVCQLPQDSPLGHTDWVIRKVVLEEEVQAISYHEPLNSYVVGTSAKTKFQLPDEEDSYTEQRKEVPQVDHGTIKILSPINWTIVDSFSLDTAEMPITIKTLNLEVSEHTHERKHLIVIGTAIVRGEDLPARGCLYIFEIIAVVPQPGRPETNRKLKLIAREEVKGAVTDVSSIGTQGFLVAAQGQKCMVRGLKEDGSLLPVAFMDMMCYVTVIRELPGTGMCVLGDALKGLRFAGYTEDPYKMTLFGKNTSKLEVMTAEFLPDGKQLYIVVADTNCNIHILQFDPEHPKSLSGHNLLNRSSFHTGHFPSSLTLLPSTNRVPSSADAEAMDDVTSNPSQPSQQILMTTQSGSLALLTPLTEAQYRRLSALQIQLTNSLEHPCGLNPRSYRAAAVDGGTGGRNVVDGTILRRYMELGSHRRAEICGKIGADPWEVRGDLEIIGGGGLGYL